MELGLAFIVFMAAMISCLSLGLTMILPLAIGLSAFALVALKRKYELNSIVKMALKGMRDSLVVIIVMLLIGCLTSLWRQCGTIACFTYHGVKLIPPRIFIFSAFALTSLMSYALGTSFGTAGAIGVILMTIARANGISTALTGGAILSGLYFGDRGSPAASSASLVANETHTEVSENFKRMLPSSVLPMAICAVFYLAVSLFVKSGQVELTLLHDFEAEFNLTPLCLLPTVLMLVLAFAGMKITRVMAIDIVFSFALTPILQKTSILQVLKMTVTGYTPANSALNATLAGGGIASMLEVSAILLLSSGCSGIFEGTGMLSSVEAVFARISEKFGRFTAMIAASVTMCAVFCNQTIGIMMCRQVMGKCYPETKEGRRELMLDIENSVVVIAGLVPWCIACSVPLKMLGLNESALPFAMYLYLIPICHFFKTRLKQRKLKGSL